MIVGLLMLGGGAAAGVFGSLLGLGGGVLLVPLLTLGFGLPLREAVGVSLISVIVTSSAAAGVYLERHVANLRLGMTLELFTAIGALVGGSVAFLLDEQLLSLLFAGLLLYVAATMVRAGVRTAPATEPVATDASETPETLVGDDFDRHVERVPEPTAPATTLERLSGPGYHVRNLGLGVVGATVAGVVSALLGIGGGTIKVPLMHLAMGVPFRVATATSNMMIGITATASAVIYLIRGGIDPYVAAPTAIGVFVGATIGSRLGHRVDLRVLRLLFVFVLVWLAIQMLIRAFS
ncbi:MAG TPA: sulfite exporter TauE/SafE family protein [Candidatus Limnocylindrales bacterium]